ncbi:mitomycin antibiotics/polyketide fumonisin biosynthesis protein [Mycolicibacterium mageritense DSM 44476 = CIP 104973]|uniref:Phytanoyl-CoA dioxygenase n=2 Tax=Mycolicibacterium mageritense TaxID=53462 RepID=A0ABM7HWK0_MYCME|nr:phytanoyl-CoA dioxygenase [Mycolicibacterium mageritense]CDO20509.1 mitomycin antibiotics/polyketide fumonisin biosynthesis protein [Mycolicibacterium mageritense DSM 44476 = CIP 104973]
MVANMVEVDAFVRDGFTKVDRAAPREIADMARNLLWRQLGLSPDEPDSWTEPVRWTADLTGAGPFGQIVASARLAAALDALCGPRGWTPRHALGNIPVRFPVQPSADDRGWHIDHNTPLSSDEWAVSGRPHTLLLLTLLSEVGPDDAPTRIRVGSHRDVAAVLGEEPVDAATAGAMAEAASRGRPVAHATGEPGDMYLLHPFTVHAADEHRGRTPRFMAQAPILLSAPLTPHGPAPLAQVWRHPRDGQAFA